MSDLDILLALMRDPPCDICKARRAVHMTDELFSRHAFLEPNLRSLADWFEEVNQHVSAMEKS